MDKSNKKYLSDAGLPKESIHEILFTFSHLNREFQIPNLPKLISSSLNKIGCQSIKRLTMFADDIACTAKLMPALSTLTTGDLNLGTQCDNPKRTTCRVDRMYATGKDMG